MSAELERKKAILMALTEALHMVRALSRYVGNLAQDRSEYPEGELDDDDLKFAQGLLARMRNLLFQDLELSADEVVELLRDVEDDGEQLTQEQRVAITTLVERVETTYGDDIPEEETRAIEILAKFLD